MTFDHDKFSKAIRAKRVVELNIDMRQAAKLIGISASTLSRVERSGMPDIITFGLICNWLKKDLKTYLH
jgi:transcriptional regulator with XRE-family HTH domain